MCSRTLREGTGGTIRKALIVACFAAVIFPAAPVACAQSTAFETTDVTADVVLANGAFDELPDAPTPAIHHVAFTSIAPRASDVSAGLYTRPTGQQIFRENISTAVTPGALADALFAGSVRRNLYLERAGETRWSSYRVRVARGLAAGMVTAAAQSSIAQALHEDTAYYRCTCTGLTRRFVHAAVSSVTARRGNDGHRTFSLALTASPFASSMLAANTWIPARNGRQLGLAMSEHVLLRRFVQDETLEFVRANPDSMLARFQARILGRFQK